MSIRLQYASMGIDEYYKNHAREYVNPHLSIIHSHLTNHFKTGDRNQAILDLCCGGGEVTSFLSELGYNNIIGCDPFTHEVYRENTGLECLTQDFKSLAASGLDKRFDTVVCSFAMHLCPPSMLPMVLYNLSTICDKLLIITPNKKPFIRDESFIFEGEIIFERVYSRLYKSQFAE